MVVHDDWMAGFPFIPFTSHLSLHGKSGRANIHTMLTFTLTAFVHSSTRLQWELIVMVNPFDDGKINDACMEENIRSCNKFVLFGGLERIMFGGIIKEPLCCQLLYLIIRFSKKEFV